ncbi:MAG: CopG family transcriptional regulator [Deltaproteobacteria bacterium]|nr:MAG: CopG family transcriptional regulator [Deltaproteobacteria bacterium]
MISLRLNPELEQDMQNTAKILGVTKSELIRKSIYEYINKIVHHSPWEIRKDYFGKYSSGQGNLSAYRKTLLKTKIMAKRK